jgi:hypothetical protein
MSDHQLTESEKDQLVMLESNIASGRKAFEAVMFALSEIRDRQLYRAESETFAAYCRANHGWARDTAKRVFNAPENQK